MADPFDSLPTSGKLGGLAAVVMAVLGFARPVAAGLRQLWAARQEAATTRRQIASLQSQFQADGIRSMTDLWEVLEQRFKNVVEDLRQQCEAQSKEIAALHGEVLTLRREVSRLAGIEDRCRQLEEDLRRKDEQIIQLQDENRILRNAAREAAKG